MLDEGDVVANAVLVVVARNEVAIRLARDAEALVAMRADGQVPSLALDRVACGLKERRGIYRARVSDDVR